jgi:hypothetical protein
MRLLIPVFGEQYDHRIRGVSGESQDGSPWTPTSLHFRPERYKFHFVRLAISFPQQYRELILDMSVDFRHERNERLFIFSGVEADAVFAVTIQNQYSLSISSGLKI